MNPKKWTILLFVFSSLLILTIISFNYITDPYGYQSQRNKYVKNLSEVSKTNILHHRIVSKGEYYLVGTSRLVRINPFQIEQLTNKKTHNIHIDGSTLQENYMLAKYIKGKDKNFIYGFDAFSFNKSRLEHKEIANRYLTYKKELKNKPNIFSIYFSAELLSASLKHRKNIKKKKDFFQMFKEENERNYNYTLNSVNIHAGYDNKNKKKNFSSFKGYSKEKVIALAKLANKDDIFIIYPKHYYNYILFSKHQSINKQYLNAIKTLVLNTEAKVWSFYQINSLTQNKENFDSYGWHFKPKIGEKIFQRVFQVEKDFPYGILLTKDNINSYIEELQTKLDSISTSSL